MSLEINANSFNCRSFIGGSAAIGGTGLATVSLLGLSGKLPAVTTTAAKAAAVLSKLSVVAKIGMPIGGIISFPFTTTAILVIGLAVGVGITAVALMVLFKNSRIPCCGEDENQDSNMNWRKEYEQAFSSRILRDGEMPASRFPKEHVVFEPCSPTDVNEMFSRSKEWLEREFEISDAEQDGGEI